MKDKTIGRYGGFNIDAHIMPNLKVNNIVVGAIALNLVSNALIHIPLFVSDKSLRFAECEQPIRNIFRDEHEYYSDSSLWYFSR